jgi:hypothetical protein
MESRKFESADKKPFYADHFSLLDVVGQYDSFFGLELTNDDKRTLIEELLGPPARSTGAAARPDMEGRE